MNREIVDKLELIKKGILPKGFKHDKLGVYPTTWNVLKLGDLCNKITDGTHKTPSYKNKGIIFISAKNIINNKLNWADVKYISQEEHNKLIKRCNPEDGDIVLSKSGSLGAPALISKTFEFSLFESLALLKYNRNKISGNYLFQYLLSPNIQKVYHLETKGLAIKHLHLEEIRKFKLILPNINEQEEIAKVLKVWDKSIELKQKLLQEKQKQKKGLMERLLTGKVRLKGFTGEWNTVLLGSALHVIKKDALPNSQNYNLLTVKLHVKGIEATDKKPNATEKGRPYYLRGANELLIGRQNFHNGGIGIVPKEMNGYIASNAISSLGVTKGDLKFYFYYLSNTSFYKRIDNIIGGTGQKEISEAMLKKLKITIPKNVTEQIEIANVINNIDKEIILLHKELELVKCQKKGLMQLLLTGIVRVNCN